MPNVYGDDFMEGGRNVLVAQMTALMASMSTAGTDPTFSYIYNTHNVAKLELNAVSIAGVDSTIDDSEMWSSQLQIHWLMEFTIRVHTNYTGDNIGIDDLANSRLLNSIINKLQSNKDLGDCFRMESVSDINIAEEFGLTTGGELTVVISTTVDYPQE